MQNYLDQYFQARYLPSDQSVWKGRTTDSSLGIQYWYQLVEFMDLQDIKKKELADSVVLIGYMCDEGVRRNQGRVGANEAPHAIREKLAKLPVHFEGRRVFDLGDIACVDGNVEGCQEMLGDQIYRVLNKKAFPVVLGGGHDVAFGHFLGIAKYAKEKKKTKVGIINMDAHFDIRPVVEKSNSGTPFNQILKEFGIDLNLDYTAIGIQKQSNSSELFHIAEQLGVTYFEEEDCEDWNAMKVGLSNFCKDKDFIYLSVDMDVFSVAYAPGVSASSAFGLTPQFAKKVISFLMQTKKVIAMDIAEVNPAYDHDNQTSALAARFVDQVVAGIGFNS